MGLILVLHLLRVGLFLCVSVGPRHLTCLYTCMLTHIDMQYLCTICVTRRHLRCGCFLAGALLGPVSGRILMGPHAVTREDEGQVWGQGKTLSGCLLHRFLPNLGHRLLHCRLTGTANSGRGACRAVGFYHCPQEVCMSRSSSLMVGEHKPG